MKLSELNPQTICNFRQNNPELVIKDAKEYLGLDNTQCEILRKILLARGINKWLKVRRDLIAYKKLIKNEIKRVESERAKCNYGSFPKRMILKEVSKTLQSVRSNLRAICKTNRWQIWPQLGSHHRELRAMNTLRASD